MGKTKKLAASAKKAIAIAYILALLLALLSFNILYLIVTVAAIYLINEMMGAMGLKIPMQKPRWV